MSGLPRSSATAPAGAVSVYGMFFLSGVGALVFENVWFSQIGLILGNSVWAAALVVGAFMAGLALGNGLAVRLARRWSNLVRGYGAVEAVAAVSGAAAVIAFPHLPDLFRPLLAPFLDQPAALNLLRLGIAFALMAIPATALGTTLPLLTRPLESATGDYGLALGRLYGLNTLGAVAGTLLAELALIPALGLQHSGYFAAACNLGAAFIATRIAASPAFAQAAPAAAQSAAPAASRARRVLPAAFLAGGILLALEVVWFRFLLLFQVGTTLMFALMLAVVLSGIALGSVAASAWSRRGWDAGTAARWAAAVAGVGVVAGYAAFHAFWQLLVAWQLEPTSRLLWLSVFLMAPVCVASGVLFTALGSLLREGMTDAAATTGMLTLANTVGALAGSLLAAFVLLPGLGLERSFLAAAALYAALAALVPMAARAWLRAAPLAAAAAALALFPFGRMTHTHYRFVEDHFGGRIVAAREGIVETAFYLRYDLLGEPWYYRLATNSYSMSATSADAQRYMRLFAYLPAALHPRIERALVICFGVGSTAAAVTDLPEMRAIDVVDVSRDILALSDIAFPDARHHPLHDPRVSVHVEDGRFFLQQTARRYDLITGEPPPPKIAGVASLYSREYFGLLRERLNPGGLATYWLPVHQLRQDDTLAIIRAFCEAFDDCSLWSGAGLEWILMGSRGGLAPVSRAAFSRLWRDPRLGEQLQRIAVETPEQMAALFMADARVLRQVGALALPLTDDFPRRVSPAPPTFRAEPLYAWIMSGARSRENFETSPWVAALLPSSLIAGSRESFARREMLDGAWYAEMRRPGYSLWADVARLMRGSSLVAWPQWLLGSEARAAQIARLKGPGDPIAAQHLAIDALVHRRKPDGAPSQPQFLAMTPQGQVVTILHRCLAGEATRALMDWIPADRRESEPYRSFMAWAAQGCAGTAGAR
jgi:predicted membrane-bound spermidine synthase